MNTYIDKIIKHSIPNKYTTWYVSIVENRVQIPCADEYIERHHILPKSIFPDNAADKDNLVFLSPREHFLCHVLLTKMFSEKKHIFKMMKAVAMFTQQNAHQDRRLTSRQYGYARACNSVGNMINVGRINSLETLNKMSAAALARDNTNLVERSKLTKQQRYGDSNYNNRQQASQTNFSRYGGLSPAASIEVVNKAKQTRIEKYGSESYNNIDQQRDTNIAKYGVSVKTNKVVECEFCNHSTTLGWYNRKHRDGQCLSSLE